MLPSEVDAALRHASVINAGGPFTAYGGSRPSEAVIEAMAAAHRTHADVVELSRRVSASLAVHLGVLAHDVELRRSIEEPRLRTQ